jgi:hypothetical protein
MRGAARDLQVDTMPLSGWLWVDDDVVDLAATPPMEQQTTIALDAALRISEGARPGPKLLDWLGHGEPAVWGPESTARLVDVLVLGNERDGIANDLLAACKRRVRVPMRGFIDSLNVSVTAAILLSHAVKDRTGDLGPEERRRLYARGLYFSVQKASEIVK